MAASSFNHFKKVVDAITPASKGLVSSVARGGAVHVRTQIESNGQVLTGNMLKSVYASTPEGSDYKSVDRGLPEVTPDKDTEAIIGVAASYSVFPNYGTIHQSPNPFWEPGVERTSRDLAAGMSDLANKLEEAAQ